MGIAQVAGKVIGKASYFWAKNNDKIEFIAGAALVAVGTGVLIHDAEKIADAKAEVESKLHYIHDVDDSEEGWVEEPVTRGKAMGEVAKTAVVEYTKACWKGVGMIAVGEVLQGVSHATITQKLTSVSASLATVSAGFANYRNNVIADQGAAKDVEYMSGPVMKSVEMKSDGTTVETTIPVHKDATNRYIPHSFFFDEGNLNWTDDDSVNRDTITRLETFINQKLSVSRWLTENDIRKFIQAPLTKAGQAAGVKYENKDGSLNHIQLRIMNPDVADKNYLIVIEYSDGRPISDNILDDTDWDLC